MLFYTRSLTEGIRGLIELNHLFHKRVINGIVNGVGIISFSCGERYKIFRGSRTFLFTLFFLSSLESPLPGEHIKQCSQIGHKYGTPYALICRGLHFLYNKYLLLSK